MITEQGVVEEVWGGKVRVRVEKSSACATCQSRESCHEVSGKDMIIEMVNELGAGKGDRVEISIPGGSFLILSLLVYLLPVAALMAGAVAGGAAARAFQIDLTAGSIVGGFLGIALTFCALKRVERSARAQRQFTPKMTRVFRHAPAMNSCEETTGDPSPTE